MPNDDKQKGLAACIGALGALAFVGVVACERSGTSGTTLAGACAATSDADTGVAPYESVGSGAVHGTGVDVSVCNVGVYLEGNGQPQLDFDSSSQSFAANVQAPAGGVDGTFSGFLQLTGASAGVYKSADASACGSLTFSYGVPADPGISCATDGGFTCPKGCASSFNCAGGYPCCAPLANTFVYQASVACAGGAPQPALGSWSVTVSSVETYQSQSVGEGLYVAHGTLTATLQGTADTTASVSLSLSF